jgi:uncharacterized protein YcbK (DUF882 family)
VSTLNVLDLGAWHSLQSAVDHFKHDGRFHADNVLELRKLVRDTWQQWLQTNPLGKLLDTLDRILPLIKEANGRNDYELPLHKL